MIVTKCKSAQMPGNAELLLPWLATGRLNAAEARRVRAALARDPELARDYAAVQDERQAAIALHDELGAPSPRAMRKLFAAIDAAPQRRHIRTGVAARLFAALSPRLLVWAVAMALVVLLVQAVVIGLKAL